MVLSSDAVSRVESSLEKQTLRTGAVCTLAKELLRKAVPK